MDDVSTINANVTRSIEEYSAIEYSKWQVPAGHKLHEDSYRRQIQKEQNRRQRLDESIQEELSECSFRPVLAPSTKKHLKELEEPTTVFERLTSEAKAVEIRHQQLRQEHQRETDAREMDDVTFRPATNEVPAAVSEEVKSYTTVPVTDRLYHSLMSKMQQHNRPTSSTSQSSVNRTRARTFSSATAKRLSESRQSVSSQARELRERMSEEEVLVFRPTLSHRRWANKAAPEPTPTRTSVSRKSLSRQQRFEYYEDRPLEVPGHRDHREQLLAHRPQQRVENRARKQLKNAFEPVQPAVPLMKSEQVKGIVDRLVSQPVTASNAQKQEELREKIAAKERKKPDAIRKAQLEYYKKMQEDGAFEPQLADYKPRRSKSVEAPAIEEPVVSKVQERSSSVSSKPVFVDPNVVKRQEESFAKSIARAREARQKTLAAVESETPAPEVVHPLIISRSTAPENIEVKGMDAHYKRAEAARTLAERRRKELQQRWRPQSSSVVRTRDDQGRLITKVAPFKINEEHTAASKTRKEQLMAAYLSEEAETTCTFHPITVSHAHSRVQ